MIDKELIVTKDVEQFLQHEFECYPSMTNYNVFESAMIPIIDSCKICGTIYWQGCKLRCKCVDEDGRR